MAAAATGVTAVLGPSAAEAPLGGRDDGATPPWHLATAPPSWLVTVLLAVAVAGGVVALTLALTGRWRPRPARLAAAGVLVVAALGMLPPIGSADPLSYAAYGHIAATGHDPYTTAPAEAAARLGDPVAAAAEAPWQHTPSVYGPIATGEQALAARIGGDNVAVIVWLLGLVGVAAFALTALLLHQTATDETSRRRAAALWAGNPLLWLHLGAGGHLDVLVAASAVGALVLVRRSTLAAGALVGVAACLKAPAALVWLALVWVHRASWRALLALTVGAAAVVIPSYAFAGSGAVHQLSRASRLVSLATPWRPVLDVTHAPRRLIGLLALLLFAALAVALLRRAQAGRPVAVVALALTLAYVLAAPYALPWYDALPWALAPLVAATWRDWVLLAHTSVLSLAYLPGRAAVALPGALHDVTSGMRTVVSPLLLTVLLVAVLLQLRVSRR